MPTSYYTGFDTLTVDENGVPVPMPEETVDVYNETASASLGTLETDAYGVIPAGSFSIAAGSVVRFTVSGYAGEIRRTTTAAVDFSGVEELSLILEDLFADTPNTPAYNDVYIRESAESEPRFIGTVAPGGTLEIPYNPAADSQLEVFAIARADTGQAGSFDLVNAVSTTFTPNRAIEVPTLAASDITNTSVLLSVANYPPSARYRRIKVSTSIGMTSPTTINIDANEFANKLLPETYLYTKASESGAVTRYFTVEHSSNGTDYSPASDPLEVEFDPDWGVYDVPVLFDDPPTVALLGEDLLFTWKEPKQNGYPWVKAQVRLITPAHGASVVGAHSSGALAIELDDVSNFPASGKAVINFTEPEIVSYTALTGNFLNGVTRGIEGTTAQAMTGGEFVMPVDVEIGVKDLTSWQIKQPVDDSYFSYRWENSVGWSRWATVFAPGSGNITQPDPPSPPLDVEPDPPADYEDPLDPLWIRRKYGPYEESL